MQVRQLKIENERLRLEAREATEAKDRPDPRVSRLEAENRRLRDELIAARSERDSARAELEDLQRSLDRTVGLLSRQPANRPRPTGSRANR